MRKTHGKVEDYNALDISKLHKAEVLKPGYVGSWFWSEKATIGIKTIEQRLILSYTANATAFDYPVQIDSTPCNYGGVRYWFKCPSCYKRVGKLYIDGNFFFECRQCKNLNYATQQENKLDGTRLVMCRIRNKLNWQYDNAWMKPYYKVKPKGMHQTTFNKLVDRHDQLENKTNRYLMANFKALSKRFKLEIDY